MGGGRGGGRGPRMVSPFYCVCLWCGFPPAPPHCGCGRLPPPPCGSLWCPLWLRSAAPPSMAIAGWASGVRLLRFRPALSSKANDSDEYYGDDDDGDGGHDPHPHSPQVPCSRVPNENHSNTCSSVHESEPNRNSAWSDKRPIQFSQEHHKPSTIYN